MTKKTSRKTDILNVTPAGDDHQVVSTLSENRSYRREPCSECPWKVDNDGSFPPEAFRVSANTAYDMSKHKFGCHMSGTEKPATCAGFLLKGANHNLSVRMLRMTGAIQDDIIQGNAVLHQSYRAMAIANGVDPDDPSLSGCRD